MIAEYRRPIGGLNADSFILIRCVRWVGRLRLSTGARPKAPQDSSTVEAISSAE